MRRCLAVVVVLLLPLTALPALGLGDRFLDVGADHTFVQEIEWLADQNITRGCNPPTNDRFCPDDVVTRGQMAAFLVRALKLPSAGPRGFVDTAGSVFAADIDSLAAAGVTRGCNPPTNDRFCPDDVVTRGQMAAFLVRALKLPSAGPEGFVDTAGSVFAADIDSLAAAGVTRGCNPPANDRFCPDQAVTRGQMAAFLYRALPRGFEIVSVSGDGVPGDGDSYAHSMSADGRYVAFASTSGNLVAGDSNGAPDVFVRDRIAKTTERIAPGQNGTETGGSGTGISNDGRFVVFESDADNLVPGDTNGRSDIFLYDRQTGSTTRISVGAEGEGDGPSQAPRISQDGRYVVFHTYATNLTPDGGGAILYSRETGELEHVGAGYLPILSGNGRYVVYPKSPSDEGLIRYDRITKQEVRVDVSSAGVPAETASAHGVDISADGRFVLFQSSAGNLVADDTNGEVDLFLRDMELGTTIRVNVGTGDKQLAALTILGSVSDDGQRVAFSTEDPAAVNDDQNEVSDIFLREVASKITKRLNLAPSGEEANGEAIAPILTADGKGVLFMNRDADNLVLGGENQLLFGPVR